MQIELQSLAERGILRHEEVCAVFEISECLARPVQHPFVALKVIVLAQSVDDWQIAFEAFLTLMQIASAIVGVDTVPYRVVDY